MAGLGLAGAKWALFSAYGLYSKGLLPHAVSAAKQVRLRLPLKPDDPLVQLS